MAHAAYSKDANCLACRRLACLDCLVCGYAWAEKWRSMGRVKVVWDWSRKFFQCTDVFSIASLHSLTSYLSAFTQVLPPGHTILALEAGAKKWLDANPATYFDLFHAISYLFNNAHDFVARYHWQA